jgi:hypothetical protein
MLTNSRAWRQRKVTENRERVFREGLLESPNRSSEEARRAIAYCHYCIETYEDWFYYNEAKWLFWQRVVIIGGVVATLAGVVTLPQEWLASIPWANSFGWLRGVPAGAVTIAAAYLSSFTYREDAVRHEVTACSLWNELAKFMGKAEPYGNDEPQDTSEFLNTITRIVGNELQSWSALVSSTHPSDSARTADTAGKTP